MSMKALATPGFLLAFMMGGLPAGAGMESDAEVVDVVGDANALSPITGMEQDTRPASVDWADLRAVWFATSFETTKELDEQGNVARVRHMPTGLLIRIQTEAPLYDPQSPPGSPVRFYDVAARLPGCSVTFRLSSVPSHRGQLIKGGDCPGSAGTLTSPVSATFDGNVASVPFPFSTPALAELLVPGQSLDDVSAKSWMTRPGSNIAIDIDSTPPGRSFVIGQDVPPDVDCNEQPEDPACHAEPT